MFTTPRFLITDPSNFEVTYKINPWMDPDTWLANPTAQRQATRRAFESLTNVLISSGAELEVIPAVPGLPDLVFPANAAIVFNGTALLARFVNAERRGEEPVYRRVFQQLVKRGWLRDVVELPSDIVQEGAGDCIWDRDRDLFWAAHGKRSHIRAIEVVERVFNKRVVPIELVSDRFYHLDTCFCPLSGGTILFYPAALSAESVKIVRSLVPQEFLLEACDEDAAALCVNAINLE